MNNLFFYMFTKKNNSQGFTLIELLIVIAILAILAGVVFVALNPLARFQDARDARRWTDVTALISAIKVHQVDNKGYYYSPIASTTAGLNYMIGTAATGCNTGCTATTTQAACVNLAGLVTAGYISAVPVDQSGGTDIKTLYYLNRSASGTIAIGACVPERTAAIRVSR